MTTSPVVEPASFSAVDQSEEIARLRALLATQEREAAGVIDGFAVCMSAGCERFDTPAPCAMLLDVVELRGELGIERTSEYLNPLDDADFKCPGCGGNRTLLPKLPVKYAELSPR